MTVVVTGICWTSPEGVTSCCKSCNPPVFVACAWAPAVVCKCTTCGCDVVVTLLVPVLKAVVPAYTEAMIIIMHTIINILHVFL